MKAQTSSKSLLSNGRQGRIGISLSAVIRSADHLQEVRKSSISSGDWIFVRTVRSLYRIQSLGNGLYKVSGGWFDKKCFSPVQMRISGCTWGGSVIKVDLIAACGLRIEFGNRLVTSTIQKIFVMPHSYEN